MQPLKLISRSILIKLNELAGKCHCVLCEPCASKKLRLRQVLEDQRRKITSEVDNK